MDIMEDEEQRNVAKRPNERKMSDTRRQGKEGKEISKVEGESRREGRRECSIKFYFIKGVLSGIFPQSPSQFQFQTQSQMETFCREVPTTPRLYPMPAFAQDRHTCRGREMKNTLCNLEAHCAKRGLQMPSNPEYTHGPSAFQTCQGFAEFMEHVRVCEERNGDGIAPWFKEEAMRLYEAQPPGQQKRAAIIKTKLGATKAPKRSRPQSQSPATKRSRCVDWATRNAPEDFKNVRWEVLSLDRPMAQLPSGGKPPVLIDFPTRRVWKGPFTDDETPLQSLCLTRLAREVFGLRDCVPEVQVFVAEDGRMGLVSPMIGCLTPTDKATKTLSDNADRGMCKLHEYENERGLESLTNADDILKIFTIKAVVESRDNNTSNLLVVKDRRWVYGVDVGGSLDKAKLLSKANQSATHEASCRWAFSKPPNKHLMSQIDHLAKQCASEMLVWLRSLATEEIQQHYRTVVMDFPFILAPVGYSEVLNAFISVFERMA